MLSAAIPDVLEGVDREWYDRKAEELREAGVQPELAARVASMPALFSVFDIVEVAEAIGRAAGGGDGHPLQARLQARPELAA